MRINFKEGMVFSKWTVIAVGSNQRKVLCRCECGAENEVYKCHIISGNSKGCFRCGTVTHGASHTRTWASWQAMKERCNNSKHLAYKHYGGRGLRVCDRWADFALFLLDMGIRPEGMSLDRIDTNSGYEPKNCRWATPKEQSNNQTSNRIVIFEDREYTVAQLAEKLGLNYQTLRGRIKRGAKLDGKLRDAKTPHAKNPSKARIKPIEGDG